MELISLDQWQGWSKQYNMLPYIMRVKQTSQVASWEQVWQESSPYSVLLESGKGGRYTYLAPNPEAILTGKDGEATLQNLIPSSVVQSEERRIGSPLEVVKEWMSSFKAPRIEGLPPFLGGIAGYWSYDVARSLERLPSLAQDDLETPDYVFLQCNQLYIMDQLEQSMYIVVWKGFEARNQSGEFVKELYFEAVEEAKRMNSEWTKWQANVNKQLIVERQADWAAHAMIDRQQANMHLHAAIKSDFPEESFNEAVMRIQEYIRAGDVFQVNLSLRQHKELHSNPAQVYEWLRMVNPSPYMSFIRLPQCQIVSGSPELLVKLQQGRIATRPIAGTRRRGRDEAEETKFQQELLDNVKEGAEHIMLVDLLRNDLGRVSRYDTVQVSEFMTIEAYSHVMHLVSQVEGELMREKDAYDVLRAVFPGGTITGAPKIRTMEIIEELEPFRRGLYTGSIGWIDYTGDMEFNIVIRTMLVQQGVAYIQAGAGIVIDSSPEREYKESMNKARALWKAIERSEREATI